MALGGTEATGAATPSWSVVSSPSPPARANGALHAVACPSAAECFAVGEGGDDAPLVGSWNGSAWSIRNGASPGSSVVPPVLNAIACPTATNCIAVGQYRGGDAVLRSLIESWDGTGWQIVAGADPIGLAGQHLAGVACTDLSNCWAVGWATDTSDPTIAVDHADIEHWDGTSWSLLGGIEPPGAFSSRLSGVACTGTADCVAVGTVEMSSRGGWQPLIAGWDGASWTPVTNPALPTGGRLLGVTCPDGTTCFAVGAETSSGDDTPLGERISGSTVSVEATPDQGSVAHSDLRGITCTSASTCFAVGTTHSSPLVDHRTSAGWSTTVDADTNDGGGSFDGVACVSETRCVAVGADSRTRIEQWNGTRWTAVGQGGSQSSFADVSCAGPASCFAVGYASGRALVERWNGSFWATTPSPRPADAPFFWVPGDVSCAAANACLAVGFDQNAERTEGYAIHWNGAKWALAPPLEPRASYTTFTGVSCPSSTTCFAIGGSNGANQQLFERWDGTHWTKLASPHTSATKISCPTTTSCYASPSVGSHYPNLDYERWNGRAWVFIMGPSPGVRHATTNDITCASTTSCVAVGWTSGFTKNRQYLKPLILHWNGRRWSVAPSPDPSQDNSLTAVSCAAPTSCTAVGATFTLSYGGVQSNRRPLIERWNGTSWNVVQSATPTGSASTELSGVACATTTSCVGVGRYLMAGSQWTLAERYG